MAERKRILVMQDISCVGQCSMTLALQVLAFYDFEICILPTEILSTHTGGFGTPAVRNMTEDIPAFMNHWKKAGVRFNAIYTGYIPSIEQVDYAQEICDDLLFSGGKIYVDPAMADLGKFYSGLDMTFAQKTKELIKRADVIFPNITEACILTGMEYCENYDRAYIESLLEGLEALNAKSIILTGVSFNDTMGVVLAKGGKRTYYSHRKLTGSFYGPGDVFASSFVGANLSGHDECEAMKIAANYTFKCLEYTRSFDPTGHCIRLSNMRMLPLLF